MSPRVMTAPNLTDKSEKQEPKGSNYFQSVSKFIASRNEVQDDL
jgi:hypothetical protein